MSLETTVKDADLPENKDPDPITSATATQKQTDPDRGKRKASTHDLMTCCHKKTEVRTHRVELS
jgi:hypothetical protein